MTKQNDIIHFLITDTITKDISRQALHRKVQNQYISNHNGTHTKLSKKTKALITKLCNAEWVSLILDTKLHLHIILYQFFPS